MSRAIPEVAVHMIEQFEGGRSSDGLFHAYWDSLGHVETIGFGETQGVHAGETWTLAQAEADLRNRLARQYAPPVEAAAPWVNDNQFAALLSLVWNCGDGVVGSGHTMGDALHRHDARAASAAFMVYVMAGGSRIQGLVNRRAAERKLFDTPVVDRYAMFDGVARSFPRDWLKRIPELDHARKGGLLRSFSGGKLTITEKDVVHGYDVLAGQSPRPRWQIRRRQLWMIVLRYRIAWAAHQDGWDKYHRRARWQAMWERSKDLA